MLSCDSFAAVGYKGMSSISVPLRQTLTRSLARLTLALAPLPFPLLHPLPVTL
jgi:hypothetical protein